jgi:NDP-sugar pyrophosphorylase family protein
MEEIDKLNGLISDTQIVILAGGQAKRMGSDRAKALLELNGRPLLDYSIEMFKRCGFRNFVLLLGYKHEEIEEYVENASYGVNISYSVEPPDVKGKGKALTFALTNNKINKKKRCVLHFPDDLLLDRRLPLRFLMTHLYGIEHLDTWASSLLVSGTVYPFGVAERDPNGIVTSFSEKPFIEKLTNTGMCIFEPQVYRIVEEMIDLKKAGSVELETTVLPHLASMRKLYSMVIPHDVWLSINTQKEYDVAEKILRSHVKS